LKKRSDVIRRAPLLFHEEEELYHVFSRIFLMEIPLRYSATTKKQNDDLTSQMIVVTYNPVFSTGIMILIL